MIPVPVAPPAPAVRTTSSSGGLARWLGGLLVVGGVVAAVTWYVALAPTSFTTFSESPGYARIEAAGGQEYVVTVDGPGAIDETRPPPVTVNVRGIGGRSVAVDLYDEPGQPMTGPTYRLLGREGRALATFRPPEDGSYLVTISSLGGVDVGDGYAPPGPQDFAVGRELGVTWVGTWTGLLVLGLVPLAVGGALLASGVQTGRRNRAEADGTGR